MSKASLLVANKTASLLSEVKDKLKKAQIFNSEPGDLYEIRNLQNKRYYTNCIYLASMPSPIHREFKKNYGDSKRQEIVMGELVHIFSNMMILEWALLKNKVWKHPRHTIALDYSGFFEYQKIFENHKGEEPVAKDFHKKIYKPNLALFTISDDDILGNLGRFTKIGKVSKELLDYAIEPIMPNILGDIIEK